MEKEKKVFKCHQRVHHVKINTFCHFISSTISSPQEYKIKYKCRRLTSSYSINWESFVKSWCFDRLLIIHWWGVSLSSAIMPFRYWDLPSCPAKLVSILQQQIWLLQDQSRGELQGDSTAWDRGWETYEERRYVTKGHFLATWFSISSSLHNGEETIAFPLHIQGMEKMATLHGLISTDFI